MNNFCWWAWFGARINATQKITPCCLFQVSKSNFTGNKEFNSYKEYNQSNYAKYIRKNLFNNIKLSECNACWDREKAGLPSLRKDSNQLLEKFPFSEKTIEKLINDPPLLSIDLNVSNLCNFACGMCDGHHSTKISHELILNPENDLGLHPVGYINSIDQINNIPFENLKNMKLLGGEPMINKKLIKKLQQFPDKVKENLYLHLVTNGSVDILEFSKRIGFKNLTYSVSLEGIKNVNDYARKHSNWSQIEDNILKSKDYYDITIHTTLQPMTIFGLNDLTNWANNHNLKFTYGQINNPKYLSFNAFPEKLFNRLDISDNIIEIILESYSFDQSLFEKFKKFIMWYDKTSNNKFLDVFPEFNDVWN